MSRPRKLSALFALPLFIGCDEAVTIDSKDGPKVEPCTMVEARVYRDVGGFAPRQKRWVGPETHKVCVISVDGRAYKP